MSCPNFGKGAKIDCFEQCVAWRNACNTQYERCFHSELIARYNSLMKVLFKDELTFKEWSEKREKSIPQKSEPNLSFEYQKSR